MLVLLEGGLPTQHLLWGHSSSFSLERFGAASRAGGCRIVRSEISRALEVSSFAGRSVMFDDVPYMGFSANSKRVSAVLGLLASFTVSAQAAATYTPWCVFKATVRLLNQLLHARGRNRLCNSV